MKTKFSQKVWLFAMFFALIGFMISCKNNPNPVDPNPKADTSEYAGIVINENNEPIDGAVVIVTENDEIICTDTTQVDGTFKLTNLPKEKGSLIIKVFHFKYQSYRGKLIDIINAKDFDNVIKIRLQNCNCCTGSFTFYVKDAPEGNPVIGANVKITFGNKPVDIQKTNEDGKVVFENLCEGDYSILIAKDGYQVIKDILHLGANQNVEKTYYFGRDSIRCCASLKVLVRDDATKKALENAEVRLNSTNNNFSQTKKTDANGSVLFENVCEGDYWIRVALENYQLVERNLMIKNCEAKVIEVHLTKVAQRDTCCDNRVTINLKNSGGELINGAMVKIWNNGKILQTKTSENGKVIFDGLCTGTYGISVSRDGYKPIEWTVAVTCHQSLEFSKTLEYVPRDTFCDNKATLTTVDKDGELIKGATISIWKDNHIIDSKIAENGTAIFNELCSGKYPVIISKDGYKTVNWLLIVSCHQSLEYFITLTKNQTEPCDDAIMKIKVRNANEQPIAGAKVIISDSVHTYDGYTNNEGYFVKEHLIAPATYTITISKDGFNTIQFEWNFVRCETYTKSIILQ
ncbi:MAG TPA: carboxypeptidase regulatory-like domain-containing protein [Candidatus Kapabacteria bacterium]|nr:carboxypeptidase regulatory-like domain-containing protein [Candidatus Kapabacteria bacterium]